MSKRIMSKYKRLFSKIKIVVTCTLSTFLFITCNTGKGDRFTITDESFATTIYIHQDTDELIKWAATELAGDFEEISGKEINIIYTDRLEADAEGIYIGKYDKKLGAILPDNFIDNIQNQWEKYSIKKHRNSLFIVGGDVRGTVFGIFEVAKRVGISPWKWWADVAPQKKETIVLNLPADGIESSPSVQYRGIFLNDEDWGLQPWAAKTFEPETGDIGPKTYEKIFQLLLRLKANTIWPAMHGCTKAFYKIPGNNEMAKKYHIVVGTSHCEPMLRNNVDEWDQSQKAYNYFENKEGVSTYWCERIEQVKDAENIVTLGMRGTHDGAMRGGNSKEEQKEMLEQIIKDQRQMLTDVKKKSLDSIATTVILYKEVLDLYNAGLEIPDNVTIMWCDDNYGYIRRLSNEEEQKRKGGAGIYYHLSYWGRPHDYLWLSTTQPGLIWYEMSRAYQNGAQKMWIANVGDIKPAEYDIEFFLDLAWDINSINETSIKKHLIDWSSREFGEKNANEIANMLDEYYRLAFLRKPEYMGWSRTEPRTKTRMSEFSTTNNNELQRRIDVYTQLFEKVEDIKSDIPKEKQEAYFQLVEYPVKCAALMNHKFLYAQQSFLAKNKLEKENLANKAQKAYDDIVAFTEKYNNEIKDGKWKNIISMKPRNLSAYRMPTYHLEDTLSVNDNSTEQEQDVQPVFIQAKEFSKNEGAGNYVWKTIEGFGYSNSSVTLFPFTNHVFETERPWLEYSFEVEKPGEYEVEIRCIPTHANNFDHKLFLEVNDNEAKEYSLNTKGRSEEWKENTLRNYVSVKYPVTITKKGKQVLKLSVNQTGIVLDQIAINLEGYESYYEIVN